MGFYDRIIRSHVILNSRKSRIPDNVCKLHIRVHNNMQFRNQINQTISDIHYKSTTDLPIHGAGQGTKNGGTHWYFISIPVMKIVESIAPGCTIKILKKSKTWNIHMVRFVDDKRHYTNQLHSVLTEKVIQAMKKYISTSYELFVFIGGDLEISKCGRYVVE